MKYLGTTNDNLDLIPKSALTTHTGDTDIHVTAAEKTAWNNKQSALTAGVGISIENGVISVTYGVAAGVSF